MPATGSSSTMSACASSGLPPASSSRAAAAKAMRDELWSFALAGGGEQRVGVGHVIMRVALGEQTQLQGAGPDERDVADGLQYVGERGGLVQRLLDVSGLGLEPGVQRSDRARELGDAAPLAELGPFPAELECRLRPLVQPGGRRARLLYRTAAVRPWLSATAIPSARRMSSRPARSPA